MQQCRRAVLSLAGSGSSASPVAADAAGAVWHSASAAYQRCSQQQLHCLSNIHRGLSQQGKTPNTQLRRFSEDGRSGGGDESGVARFWR
jgi:succinylarginine dihydrolase